MCFCFLHATLRAKYDRLGRLFSCLRARRTRGMIFLRPTIFSHTQESNTCFVIVRTSYSVHVHKYASCLFPRIACLFIWSVLARKIPSIVSILTSHLGFISSQKAPKIVYMLSFYPSVRPAWQNISPCWLAPPQTSNATSSHAHKHTHYPCDYPRGRRWLPPDRTQ